LSHLEIFQIVSTELGKIGVAFVLVGGYAINFYKVTRQTLDVDFLIMEEDFDRVSKALVGAGFRLELRERAFARFTGRSTFMTSDFLLTDSSTFLGILKDGKEVSIAGCKFRVPSLKHLIAMKLHSIKNDPKNRQLKDLPDVAKLFRENGLDPRSPEFRELCLRYGDEVTYKKLVDFLS